VRVAASCRAPALCRLLGLGKDAGFEEIQDARNYLYELYRWHEPSREAIELAFDSIIQEKMKSRHKFGFQPVRMGRRGVVGAAKASWDKKLYDLIDPTITTATLINEGSVFAALAAWCVVGRRAHAKPLTPP
jgi:ATP-dependent HslUV protease ATP-binding subunit HslU